MLRTPPPPPAEATRSDPEPCPGQPFCGPLEPLRRLGLVRAGTVVVAWPPHGPPELRQPGELLVPARPRQSPIRVMPVTTAPVELLVTATDLLTLDSCPLNEVDVRLKVQLDPANTWAAALSLAVEEEAGLGDSLMAQVLEVVEGTVRAAVRMNREADLRRRTLAAVLADRWLPTAYAGGRLRRLDFSVPRLRWSAPAATTLALSSDARLRRIWRIHSDEEPLGIVGARVGERVSVVVALAGPPGPYETSRAREDFGRFYGGAAPTVVPVLAGSYRSIVDSWCAQLDLGPQQVVALEANERAATLTIRFDQPLPSPGPSRPGWEGPEGSQVKALRRLLPFRAVRLAYEGSPAG